MQPTPTAPAIIVIFGITGDLAQRKLLPAIYHLYRDGSLDERSVIVGISRRDIATDDMVRQVEQSIAAAEGDYDHAALMKVQSALRMHTMSQVDPTEYRKLKAELDAIEDEKAMCLDRLYYLSIPPQMFEPIVRNLGEQGLNHSCQHGTASTRLLIEKPFGFDLASAEELISETGEWFAEEQIFRIDHYIAKDAVQNILQFRMENPEFEKMWNDRTISKLELTVFEKLDIEGRAVFYEEIGALRDFVQSHLLQMLALTAMDLPADISSSAIHAERLKVLEAITPIRADSVAPYAERGQYIGYRDEVGNTDTHTETFARLHLLISNGRWQNTEVVLQTGKALAEKVSYMRAYFHGDDGSEAAIRFNIQPTEDITLEGNTSFMPELSAIAKAFNSNHPDSKQNMLGYERVLLDAVRGDHALFTTSQEVLAAWKVVNDVVAVWSQNSDGLKLYAKGADSVA